MIRLRKLIDADMPWIFHGYSAKPQITRSLLNHNFYFSFGEDLLKKKKKAIDSLKIIPPYKLFFETDESDVSIEEIYSFAAKIMKMDVDVLRKQVYKNYRLVFENG